MTENTDFYFNIHSFMVRELGLSGAALTIYAVIYSFSSQGKGTFFASREELAEFAGVGVWTVTNTLKELVNSDLIYIAKGKKHEHKEYRINTDKLKNQSAQNSHTESVKITHEECENRTLGVGNSHTESVKIVSNNKHNNKQYIKPIINVYKGAEAPEREKELFKEDFLGDKSTAPFKGGSDTKAKTEENPIYIKDPASPSENAPSDKSKGTAEENSKTLPSQPKNSYSGSGYRKNFRRGGQNAHSSAFPTYKYMNFDPEEAFSLALARTEEWMAQINANAEAEKNEKCC